MSKTEQLKNTVSRLEKQLEGARLELEKHLSKTIYFTCPKCYKKTSLSKLTYHNVENHYRSYNSYDDDKYVHDEIQIVCPSCKHVEEYRKHYTLSKEDKYEYYKENKNLFKEVVEIKGY